MTDLFTQELNVVNVGLPNFADNIRAAGGSAVQLAWRPPGGGDADAGMRLARLLGDPRIEEANATALARYLEAQPVLVDVLLAREAIAALDGERRILHAGPPIAWADMCGPMQGAIAGAIAYEGWAATPEEGARAGRERRGRARALPPPRRGRADGRDHQPVDAGVGRRERGGRQPRVLQLQRGPRQGAALRRQQRRRARPPALDGHASCSSVLQAGVRALGGVELQPIMAQALHMGDEVHNRNAAATGLLFKRLVPALLDRRSPGRRRAPRDRVHRRQRPLLPEPLDGGLQGDARRGARRRAQHDGHGRWRATA